MTRPQRLAAGIAVSVLLAACANQSPHLLSDAPSQARAPDGQYISWVEHRIDDEGLSGVGIRGGDGLVTADLDRDGFLDIVSVHEDSHHLRIAYGGAGPGVGWQHVTVAQGRMVGAIEDVVVGDVNGDGWPDLVAACEDAHLLYAQNPGQDVRSAEWQLHRPWLAQNRGSWIRVGLADLDGDGRLEVLGANKGFSDVVRLEDGQLRNFATSAFWVEGDPLADTSWREQVLMRDGIPNHVLPADVDGDGDLDVLAASRVDSRAMLIENRGRSEIGVDVIVHPLQIDPPEGAVAGWQGRTNAFTAAFADMNANGRLDLVLGVLEFEPGQAGWVRAGFGWLENPGRFGAGWRYHRIGHTLPDWIIGIGVADLDGDGDLDAITGGYSGLNVLRGGYSGASRDYDDPAVTPASTVARLAWFENADGVWLRHDISRRVRGMYDAFAFHDMDNDGDLDVLATRGNSGVLDGVFWLEQVRSAQPMRVFTGAHVNDSRQLPLPPKDWRTRYGKRTEYVPPNKAAQQQALEENDDPEN